METSQLEKELEELRKSGCVVTKIEEFKIKQTNELIEKIEKLRLSWQH